MAVMKEVHHSERWKQKEQDTAIQGLKQNTLTRRKN